MEEQQVDLTKPIKELPKCGVEGCNNDGWIGLKGRFVCGDCIMRLNKMENDEIFDKLKIR